MSIDQEPNIASASPEQSLAQVRELLFGAQSRGFEERCDQLQDQMDRSYQRLHTTITEQLAEMQTTLRDEIAVVRGQIASEQEERRNSVNELSGRMEQKISDQVNELQNRISGVNDELRAYTLNQTQHLWDDLQSRYETLSSRLEQEMNEVRSTTTRRSSLGDMFREMASKLEEHSQAEQR